ncbi:penicillin acylase family protein [Hamadaea flava]|uniref:Penicillin acylase family protein n=1 Tax=Hamadaea flava TaxID=1742688 RepID=A0ABV8LQH0_9ACTN|nr:penicillin acylase family protein [Hamadaea flava]
MEIYRDAWGIPHVRAGGHAELAFGQGQVTALDRGPQLEVERRRAEGTSAALLGPDAVEWDVFARRARIAATARRCFDALDAATRTWVRAYVDGVNAGLPQPTWQQWTPLAVWLGGHVLFTGLPAKLWRGLVRERIGEHAVDLFAMDGPYVAGSNGWLARTAEGTTIAGDPHRILEDPGVYQQIQLACPEYDVIGLAIPGCPGIGHFGHTGSVAWAVTNAMADYQDLFAEQLRRREGQVEALGPEGWRAADVRTEVVEVAGGDPVVVETIETDRGPVVTAESAPLSLRDPAMVRTTMGFAALPALLRARTVEDVDRALDDWAFPVNVVLAADTAGGTLHRVAGLVPQRPEANRRYVVPADEGAYAWTGWQPMPSAPVGDVAVMANQRGIAAELGVEFAPAHRADRIRSLIESGAAVAEIHTDTHLASAEPLLYLVAKLDKLSLGAAEAQHRLVGWDRRMAADSTDATLFAAVRGAVVNGLARHPELAALSAPNDHPAIFQPWLAARPRIAYALEHLLRSDLIPPGDLLEIVRSAVEDAAAQDYPVWSAVHRIAPWQAVPTEEDWPGVAGDHDCVLATSSVPGVTEHCFRAPAARYAWNVARREDSGWVVPFGSSGDPGSRHYRDQLPSWLAGNLLPVVADWRELRSGRGTR